MKRFSPHIYPEWGELISDLPIEKQAEIFNAILKYPNVDVDSGVWRFIKSQIDKDYEKFQERCAKNKEISNNYWKNNHNAQSNIEQRNDDIERLPNDNQMISNDIERLPNDILNININKNHNDNVNVNVNDNGNINTNDESKDLCLNNLNYETLFFEFWQEYIPVKCDDKFVDKGSKKLSFEKFTKILKSGVRYEEIISGLRAYLNHCRENKQFTCTVPVFLNQRRWEDDYSAPTALAKDAAGKRQEPKSIVETYAELAAKYAAEDNFH